VSKPKPPRAAKCKTCGADIYWATDVSTARACPIDVAPVVGANVLLAIDASGAIKSRVLRKDEQYSRACLVYDANKYTHRRCDCCVSWLATPGFPRLIGEWGAGGLPAAIRDELERADGWIFVEVRG